MFNYHTKPYRKYLWWSFKQRTELFPFPHIFPKAAFALLTPVNQNIKQMTDLQLAP